MANSYHGQTILGELMDDLTVAAAASVDSTAAVYVGKETNRDLEIQVYAGATAVAMESTDTLGFYLQTCSTSTLGDHEAPISTSNAGGMLNASGTNEHGATHIAEDGATYGWAITATTGGVTWAVGDLICTIGVPETLMRLLGHTYVQLKTTETGDPTGTIDAFVVARV